MFLDDTYQTCESLILGIPPHQQSVEAPLTSLSLLYSFLQTVEEMASLAYHSTIKLSPTTNALFLNNPPQTAFFNPSPPPLQSHKYPFRISCDLAPKARFVARRKETVPVQQLQRPLLEYMSLPASQYSVLDAERIERVDENTFRCYVYRFKFFSFEVCPVLLVRVEEQPNGCCIKLLSCKLEGSQMVVAQNDKFDASMVNKISCDTEESNSAMQQLTSDTMIEVSIDVPFPFRAIPVEVIESSGTRVLEQILRIMLPRFMSQLVQDYQAWASGDTSRQPLGTGQI